MLTQTAAATPRPAATRSAEAPAAKARADGALAAAFIVHGAPLRFARNTEVYGESEPAEYFYQVMSGAVRTYKVLQDGRRQIGAFYLPGDVFGLEAGESRAFSAEAVVDSTVRAARRSTIVALATRDAELSSDLWSQTAGGFRLAQEHMLLLGRKNAEERVASFLLEMARRESAVEVVELPMSRQDIADYLGLTIETVSRTFTQLEDKEAIELPSSRRIRLRSRESLQQLHG
ncbi:MAG TPA: helix-turn-helix domain-containing protein [Bauldia sp.]|nr:helix-turn-helix domain-containing protein [Bauldia sp.]